jgi:hypothetical protein
MSDVNGNDSWGHIGNDCAVMSALDRSNVIIFQDRHTRLAEPAKIFR